MGKPNYSKYYLRILEPLSLSFLQHIIFRDIVHVTMCEADDIDNTVTTWEVSHNFYQAVGSMAKEGTENCFHGITLRDTAKTFCSWFLLLSFLVRR